VIASQRDLFPLPAGTHYLNCAYLSPLARPVEEAAIRALMSRRDPAALVAAHYFTGADRVRERFARLVNGDDPRRVALIPAVSYGMATVARNLPLERGQNVVVARGQFPSNVYAWRRLCAEHGAELRTVDPPQALAGRGAGWNQRLLEAVDGRTGLVALGHVHWADGTRFDLEAIRERAADVGAALVVDGSQSVGALPFDLERVRPDALVCAAYKCMMGPYGLGVAWYGPRFDDGVPLEETWLGRGGSEDFSGLVEYRDDYQPGAVRFDMGERSSFVLVPMLEAALDLLLGWRPEGVQAYCEALLRQPLAELASRGWWAEEPAWRGWHMLGLRRPGGFDRPRLEAALDERGVTVSIRGDAVRISPSVYNDPDDVAALVEALLAAG
jgi:selenocysteine lyase/cysteine desulfurase